MRRVYDVIRIAKSIFLTGHFSLMTQFIFLNIILSYNKICYFSYFSIITYLMIMLWVSWSIVSERRLRINTSVM